MTKKTGINTVLFDFDGTVMDTNNIILQSWQHTFRTIDGKERREEEILATFGEPLELTMSKFFPDMATAESVAIYRSFHHKRFEQLIDLFPGILDLLVKLKESHYKVGLVTSRLKDTTYRGLRKFDMEQYFDVIVTKDDTDKHKPDPAPILVALERLGSKPEEAVMIGDTVFDMECAANAGVISVLVGWAMAYPQEEEKTKPDYVIDKAHELFQIL